LGGVLSPHVKQRLALMKYDTWLPLQALHCPLAMYVPGAHPAYADVHCAHMPDMVTVPLLQVVVFAVALAGVGEGEGDAAGTAAACVVAAATAEHSINSISVTGLLHFKAQTSSCSASFSTCFAHTAVQQTVRSACGDGYHLLLRSPRGTAEPRELQ
jgi:hypothetical protein